MRGLGKWLRRLAPWLVVPWAAPALAETVLVCPGMPVSAQADGRLLGHLRYGEIAPGELKAMPAAFQLGQPCRMQREAAAALAGLLASARAAGITTLRGISCYRSIEHQRAVFCGKIGPNKPARTPADRARSVGPPAFSEHATGYALDFAVRPSPKCPDLNGCIAATPGGRWLLANAPNWGFELSFPPGNAQGVTWEPWHWRWIGANAGAPGAWQARAQFARARASFPANPMVHDHPAPPTPAFAPAPSPALRTRPPAPTVASPPVPAPPTEPAVSPPPPLNPPPPDPLAPPPAPAQPDNLPASDATLPPR